MDLNKDIQELPLVFLDVETTGLSAESNSICEVAAIKVLKGEVVDKYHSLVRPHHKIPYAAFCVHKISDQDLIGAPYFEGIGEKVVEFLSGSILCAYNAGFDLGFINFELKKMKLAQLTEPFLDVLIMARNLVSLKSYKLESVAAFFNLNFQGDFHRADADAYVTYLIFSKLMQTAKNKHSLEAKQLINRYGGQVGCLKS